MNPGYPGLTNEFFRIVLVQPESFLKKGYLPASDTVFPGRINGNSRIGFK